MFSRLFIKIFGILSTIFLIYALTVVFIFTPAVESNTIRLEEETGKAQLAKISVLVDSVSKNIEDYKKRSIEAHKQELKGLMDVSENLIKKLYDATQPETFREYLALESKEFKAMLTKRYNTELKQGSKESAKHAVLDLIESYRYDYGAGYFYAIDKNATIINHPLYPKLNGMNSIKIMGSAGSAGKSAKKMVTTALKKGAGYSVYAWPDQVTKKMEQKILYGFLFKPLNWVIATGFYLPEVTKQKKQEAIDYVKSLTYTGDNYFFISNYNNILISHPYLEGKDFTDVKDIKGNLIIPPAIKVAREAGEGFTTYWWKKNNNDDTPYKKLLYSRDIPEWNWVISTGVYLDEIEREIESRKKQLTNQLRQTLLNTKIGETGYIYIFDSKGTLIIHPNSKLEGTNMGNVENPNQGTILYKDLIQAYKNGDKKLYYLWDHPNDLGNKVHQKVSWINYDPYFDWYICSSAYIEELTTTSTDLKNYILLFTAGILTFALVFGLLFFKRLINPIILLAQKAKIVKTGDYSVRSNIVQNDEIGELAETFDEMLDTIEDNINTLDQKVQEKTKKLTLSNKELEKSIQQLKAAQTQLVESEKMASLGGLVAGVSHEINTPVGMALTGITHLIDQSEQLKNRYDNEEMSEDDFTNFLAEAKEIGGSIEFNLQRAANLVKSFKQVAVDQSSEELREFNAKEYTEEILTSLHNRLKKTKHKIELDIEPNLIIHNYPGAFSQILTNLIMNSVIHAYDKDDEGHINIRIERDEKNITLTYTDDGKGISKENLKKIFDPFFTTNRDHGGSGLGLNIIYNIVTQKSKGDIKVTSELGRGVKFIITIPRLGETS